MPMTLIVTRNVSNRVRGFLASIALEVAPGVYSAPRLSVSVRHRTIDTLRSWILADDDASAVLVWKDSAVPCGQKVETIGTPAVEFVEVDGLVLARHSV